MLDKYLPILTLIIIAVGFSFGAAILSRLVGEKKPSAVKLAPDVSAALKVWVVRE